MSGTSSERWSRARRLLAVFTIALMLLGMTPGIGLAEDASPEPIATEAPAETPTDVPTEEPTAIPTEDPAGTKVPAVDGSPVVGETPAKGSNVSARLADAGKTDPCPSTNLITNPSFEWPSVAYAAPYDDFDGSDPAYPDNSDKFTDVSDSGTFWESYNTQIYHDASAHGIAAANGEQWAGLLNGGDSDDNYKGPVYQGMEPVADQQLTITVWHRARTGTESAKVMLSYDSEFGGGPFAGDLWEQSISSGTTWTKYEWTFTVPEDYDWNSDTLYLGFVATSQTNGWDGNYIDMVSVCGQTANPTPTPVAPSTANMACEGGQIQRIVNGSFELPVIGNTDWEIAVPSQTGWSTLSRAPMEILGPQFSPGGGEAPDGDQWSEVNTTLNDTVYQVISTRPGKTLHITFSHRSRGQNGTMQVLVGPNINSLTQVGSNITTDKDNWDDASFDYVVPDGQTSTVFAFKALSPTGNAGNMIDAVSLCEGEPGDPTEVPTATATNTPGPSPTPTATATLEPGAVSCDPGQTQRIVNGSFEIPGGVENGGYSNVASGAQGWYTLTGDDLEFLNNWEGLQAAHGSQYSEINTTTNDTMYQEITTTPGKTLYISFYHSSRPSGSDNQLNILAGPDLDNLTQLGDTVNTDGAWVQYTRVYLVPDGQTTTVFAFAAIEPSGSNGGNEVDGVSVCEGETATSTPEPTNTPVPSAGPPVELHFRACPAGAIDAFRDCHDFGVDNLDAFLGGAPCTTDVDGNCSFDAAGGDLTIEWDSPVGASLIYCSVPSNPGVNLWDNESDTVDASGDEPVTCDIYLMQSPTPPPPADPGVKLHFRACAPGASDYFRDCHENPIPGMDAALASFGCTTDEDGNCDYDEVPAGDHTITWDGDPALLVYCSDASDRSVNLWDDGSDTVPYTDGADITCDIFILDPDLTPPAPQPTPTSVTVTDLPNTGAGILSGGGALGVGIAMILALVSVLGALGLAARRAGISPRA